MSKKYSISYFEFLFCLVLLFSLLMILAIYFEQPTKEIAKNDDKQAVQLHEYWANECNLLPKLKGSSSHRPKQYSLNISEVGPSLGSLTPVYWSIEKQMTLEGQMSSVLQLQELNYIGDVIATKDDSGAANIKALSKSAMIGRALFICLHRSKETDELMAYVSYSHETMTGKHQYNKTGFDIPISLPIISRVEWNGVIPIEPGQPTLIRKFKDMVTDSSDKQLSTIQVEKELYLTATLK